MTTWEERKAASEVASDDETRNDDVMLVVKPTNYLVDGDPRRHPKQGIERDLDFVGSEHVPVLRLARLTSCPATSMVIELFFLGDVRDRKRLKGHIRFENANLVYLATGRA